MLQISHCECGVLDQRVPQAEIDRRDTQHTVYTYIHDEDTLLNSMVLSQDINIWYYQVLKLGKHNLR